ncbi:MAG: hypothetical protein FWE69_08375, partial [Clostridiales bacterium]|nr:hypothetical protein [Clostridiales bacterium]
MQNESPKIRKKDPPSSKPVTLKLHDNKVMEVAPAEKLGHFILQIAVKRMNCGKPVVAGAGAAIPVVFQPKQ